MAYLEYHIQSGLVVEIHDEIPITAEGYSFFESDNYQVGDEFEKSIWVEENENNTLISFVRNNPHAKRLLEENDFLKQENQRLESLLKTTQNAVDFLIMNNL